MKNKYHLISLMMALVSAGSAHGAEAMDPGLPGIISYRGQGILPWPGHIPEDQLPAAYAEALPEQKLEELLAAAADWCEANGYPRDAARIRRLTQNRRQPTRAVPGLFWPVPQPESNPLIAGNSSWDYTLLHPQSPQVGNPALLKKAMSDIKKWSEDSFSRDHSRGLLLAYLRFKSRFPHVLPEALRDTFEKNLAAHLQSIIGGEEGGTGVRYAEKTIGHIKPNHALKSATLQHLGGLILEDPRLIRRGGNVMDMSFKHLHPDGAVRYSPNDVPDTFYMLYNTNHLLEYWLVSGNPQARAMLVTMAMRIPLYYLTFRNAEPGDMPYRIAGGNQSNFRHGYDPTHADEGYIESAWRLAMVSGLTETVSHPLVLRWEQHRIDRTRPSQAGINSWREIDPFLYRGDLERTPDLLAEPFIFHGRNEDGAVGRFGDWSFRMVGLDRSRRHGVQSNFWAGHQTGFYDDWPYFINIYGRVGASAVSASGKDVASVDFINWGIHTHPGDDPTPVSAETGRSFRMDHLAVNASASTTQGFGAVTASSISADPRRSGKISRPENPGTDDRQWQVREAWLGTPERLVGYMEMTLLRDTPAQAVSLLAHIKGTTHVGELRQNSEHFTYRDLGIRVVDSNLSVPTAALDIRPATRRFQAYTTGNISIFDKSVPSDTPVEQTIYPAGTRFFAVLEIRNHRLATPAEITYVGSDTGGVVLSVQEEDRAYTLVYNGGRGPILVPALSDTHCFFEVGEEVASFKSGVRYRPGSLDFLVTKPHEYHDPDRDWGVPDQKGQLHIWPGARNFFAETLPPGAHLVLVSVRRGR